MVHAITNHMAMIRSLEERPVTRLAHQMKLFVLSMEKAVLVLGGIL